MSRKTGIATELRWGWKGHFHFILLAKRNSEEHLTAREDLNSLWCNGTKLRWILTDRTINSFFSNQSNLPDKWSLEFHDGDSIRALLDHIHNLSCEFSHNLNPRITTGDQLELTFDLQHYTSNATTQPWSLLTAHLLPLHGGCCCLWL